MKKSEIKKEKAKNKMHSDEDSVKEEYPVKEEEGEPKLEEDGGPKKWYEDSED